jgi:hypothetical protein
LKNIPKTAAGFEADFMSLKKDLPTFYQYVKNIPIDTVVSLFKKVEISAELFSAILKVLNDFGIGEEEGQAHAAKLLVAVSKASSFDMTLMFIDTKEKKDLANIIQTIKKTADKDVIKQIDTIYKL